MKKEKWETRVKRILGNISLGKSLGIQMLVVSLIIAGLGIISLYANRTIEKQANDANLKILSMTIDKIDEQILTAENQMASYLTSRRSELVEIKRNTANREYLYTILDKEMKNSFSANSWIQASFLYNSAGQRMVSFRSFEYSLLEDVRDYNQSIISGEESFSNEWVARKIGDKVYLVRTMHTLGYYLTVYMDGEPFLKVIEKGENNPFSLLFFTDENRKAISDEKLSASAEQQIKDFGQELIYNDPREAVTVIGSASDRTGLSLIGLRYKSFLQKNIGALQLLLAMFMMLAVAYVVGWSWFNRKTLVHPVDKLVKAMEEVENGNLHVKVEEEAYYQEFRCLNYQFNRMVSEIEKLKIDVYEEQLNRQNSELKFLLLQINPHFFLNALNILYTLALTRQTDKIKELVAHLMKHSRYILKARNEKIEVEEELKHIENFIEIQRIRYTYPILFTREGEEELEDCLIPPMMLYTFVENSVKYGLVDEAEGVHITLQIEKSREGEKQGYYFRIRDSGPGYAEDVLPVLNSGDTLLDRRGEEHYGVANVVQRLAILYHGDAEIKFENGTEGGAAVEIWLPEEQREEAVKDEGFTGG